MPDRDTLGGGDSGVASRTTNMILEELGSSKREYIIIGATNYIERMDKAAIRAGRFDMVLPIFLPDASARKAIWNVHTNIVRKIPLAKDIDVDYIVKHTWLWNGAEIEQLAKDSAQLAFRENTEYVTNEQVQRAIEDTKVNLEARKANVEAVIRNLKGTQRYRQSFLEAAIRGMQQGEDADVSSKIDALIKAL